MAKIGEFDIYGAKILNRDFGGEKFGPESRSFSIEIEDPELQDRLSRDGVKLYTSRYVVDDEPPKVYLSIRVDFRFGDVDIAMITPEGNAEVLNERTVSRLDQAWIKNSEMHVVLNTYKSHGREGVTAYCKTLVVWLMSKEEQDAIREERGNPSNPVRDKYKNIFGG